ncbi:hypothetical protein AAG570_008347 [Ranatra chinensis]|uniref:Chromatin accessibility complex protein 1 n=1 Tax=Ranatra chinensis TaxID=642074 RepID=A0ABD0YGS2_9HEMI
MDQILHAIFSGRYAGCARLFPLPIVSVWRPSRRFHCFPLRLQTGMAEGKRKDVQLPINRIKTIMKSSPDVETISQEALYLVCKCAELFIQYLTTSGLGEDKDKLDYKHVANFIEKHESLNFLAEILPQKMTVRECREFMKRYDFQEVVESSSDDSTDEDKELSQPANS